MVLPNRIQLPLSSAYPAGRALLVAPREFVYANIALELLRSWTRCNILYQNFSWIASFWSILTFNFSFESSAPSSICASMYTYGPKGFNRCLEQRAWERGRTVGARLLIWLWRSLSSKSLTVRDSACMRPIHRVAVSRSVENRGRPCKFGIFSCRNSTNGRSQLLGHHAVDGRGQLNLCLELKRKMIAEWCLIVEYNIRLVSFTTCTLKSTNTEFFLQTMLHQLRYWLVYLTSAHKRH